MSDSILATFRTVTCRASEGETQTPNDALVASHADSRPGMGVVVILLATLSAAAACTDVAPPSTRYDVVIEQVTVISPTLDAPLVGTDVAIEGGLIVAIGESVRSGAGAQVVDGRGKYLIPGLIDSHVHIGSLVALDDASVEKRPELVSAYHAQLPRSYLAFGFTTLVDVDLEPENRQWFEDAPLHPHLYACGRAVRTAGGYGALRVPVDADEQALSHLVYEPARSERWPATLNPEEHTPKRVVDRVVEARGVCVKAFVETGFGVFDWPVPTPETLAALRAEAAARGLTFIIHATSVESWQAALDANPDVIAHSPWHWPGDRLNVQPGDELRAVIERAARSGVGVQPTLQVIENDRAIFDASLLDDPRMSWALPAEILANLQSEDAQGAQRRLAAVYEAAASGTGATMERLLDAGHSRALVATRLMVDANVRLLFGSDTPAAGQGFGNPPGLNGRLELQHWADAGVPLDRILRAATLDNALAFGLSDEFGSIEPGKRADMLLLTGNPLENVAAYDSIEIVFLGGQPIARAALQPSR